MILCEQIRDFIFSEESQFIRFLINPRLTADNAGRIHRGNHMSRVAVAPDHIVIMKDSEKCFQLYFQSRLFPNFPQGSLFVGFIHFKQPADKPPFSVIRATLEQDLIIFDD